MPTYGLTAAGFVVKPFSVIQAELAAAYQAAFGVGIPLDGGSVFGQLIGIHADRESSLWQVAQDVYLSTFPDSATGQSLDSSASITGQFRLPQTFSSVAVTLTGVAGSVIPAGSIINTTGTSLPFGLLASVTIGAGGTAAGVAVATLPGPLAAPAGTLTVIGTPVIGWASVTNAVDATLGRLVESDPTLRGRRATALVTSKGGPVAAIQAVLAAVPGVTFVGVRQNATAVAVGSLPPYSIEAVVIGGADQDVANALWGAKPAAATLYGSYGVVPTVTDAFGNAQPVPFSRGTNVPMYLAVTLTTGSGYPATGNATVKTLLAAFINTLPNNSPVYNWQLVAALASVPGILTVSILQDRNPAPTTSANTAIAANEKATAVVANISVAP